MQDKINDKKIIERDILKILKEMSMGFFLGFIYLSVFFSLLMVTYLLALKELTGLALIGLFILKGLIIFYLIYLFFILLCIFKEATIRNRLKFEERRSKLKEELKLEILEEIKNRRRNTTGKKSN